MNLQHSVWIYHLESIPDQRSPQWHIYDDMHTLTEDQGIYIYLTSCLWGLGN